MDNSLPSVSGSVPVFCRIGEGGEHHIGDLTFSDAERVAGKVPFKMTLAELFRSAADAIEESNSEE